MILYPVVFYEKTRYLYCTMRLNKEQFRQFILNEVKRIVAQDENAVVAPVTPIITEEKTVVANETVEEPKIEIAEVKKLTEEFTRMKELVDFRSPLLRKENQ